MVCACEEVINPQSFPPVDGEAYAPICLPSQHWNYRSTQCQTYMQVLGTSALILVLGSRPFTSGVTALAREMMP